MPNVESFYMPGLTVTTEAGFAREVGITGDKYTVLDVKERPLAYTYEAEAVIR